MNEEIELYHFEKMLSDISGKKSSAVAATS